MIKIGHILLIFHFEENRDDAIFYDGQKYRIDLSPYMWKEKISVFTEDISEYEDILKKHYHEASYKIASFVVDENVYYEQMKIERDNLKLEEIHKEKLKVEREALEKQEIIDIQAKQIKAEIKKNENNKSVFYIFILIDVLKCVALYFIILKYYKIPFPF